MSKTPITIVGNLTADPDLRFTPSGAAVANFTVASTPQMFDKQTNGWKDGETLFMRCSVWREAAEHVAESLHRGDRVVVTGALVARSWEQDGQKRTVMEMQADEVGPSLRYATAQVTKAQRQQQGQRPQGNQSDPGSGQWSQGGPRQQADPWQQPQQQQWGGGGSLPVNTHGDEPPFAP